MAYFFTLGAHDCLWFVLEKAKHRIEHSKSLPLIRISDWNEIISPPVREILERKIFEDYFRKMRWFGGKGREIEDIKIIQYATVPMRVNSAIILLIELRYHNGLPETYQLPIAYGKGQLSKKLKDGCPQSVIARVKIGEGNEGILYDAIYGLDFQEELIYKMARKEVIPSTNSEIQYFGNHYLSQYASENNRIKPRVLAGEQSNTSIIYDNKFFLKLFRKVDRSINPDLELTRFLTEEKNFQNTPGFVGSVEWRIDNAAIVLGLMQEMVEASGDAWTYMLERLDTFNENILAQPDLPGPPPMKGTLLNPVEYDDIPDPLKLLIDGSVAEQAHLLGVRTGEMHLLLSQGTSPDFRPEPYSLHYQRSLYAGLQTLVRGTFENQAKNMHKLSPEIKNDAATVMVLKEDILRIFKRIYQHKIDVVKIRIHGDYHLGQVLNTGKDFVITDFEGEPARSFSERRLKRSPLRDVAGMIRSFHYAAFGSLFLDNQIRKEDHPRLIPFVEQWYHYMSQFFMSAYLETVKGSPFIPKDKSDLEVLMTTFILEKAVYELNYELNNRPDWVVIPLRGIKDVIEGSKVKIHSAVVQ